MNNNKIAKELKKLAKSYYQVSMFKKERNDISNTIDYIISTRDLSSFEASSLIYVVLVVAENHYDKELQLDMFLDNKILDEISNLDSLLGNKKTDGLNILDVSCLKFHLLDVIYDKFNFDFDVIRKKSIEDARKICHVWLDDEYKQIELLNDYKENILKICKEYGL